MCKCVCVCVHRKKGEAPECTPFVIIQLYKYRLRKQGRERSCSFCASFIGKSPFYQISKVSTNHHLSCVPKLITTTPEGLFSLSRGKK